MDCAYEFTQWQVNLVSKIDSQLLDNSAKNFKFNSESIAMHAAIVETVSFMYAHWYTYS